MRKSRGSRRRVPPFAVLAFIGLLIAVVAHCVIPYNDDEFLLFWPIICGLFPGNGLEDMCAQQWLRLPLFDVTLPLRSYAYAGSLINIPFFPLYLVWPSPILVRFLNMIAFAAQAIAYGKLYKRSPYVVYAGLVLFFPYFFQHVSDVGPVMVHTLSIPLFLLLIRRWFVRGEWWPPVAAAFLIAVATWSKLNYFWFIPSLGILTCMELILPSGVRHVLPLSRIVKQACFAFAVLSVLLLVYIGVRNPVPDGSRPIWDMIMSSSMYGPSAYLHLLWNLRIVHAFLNPLEATQRVFEPFTPTLFMALYDVLLYIVLPFILIVPLLFKHPRRQAARAAVAYVAFLIMAFVITSSKLSSFMHHAVLSYPFLIVAFFEIFPALQKHWCDSKTQIFERAVMLVVGALWIACNIGAFAVMALQPVRDDSDWGRNFIYEVLDDPRIASRYTVVSSSWGTYFQNALFGPETQSVLHIRADEQNLAAARNTYKIVRKAGRKLLIVTMNDGINFWSVNFRDVVRRTSIPLFHLHRCDAVPVDSVWQVYLEDDKRADNPCFTRK